MSLSRLVKLLIAAALVGLVVWIARNTYWDQTTMPGRPKGEAATDPFYAARKLAQALGATAQRDRGSSDVGSDGVIFLDAWNWDLGEIRRRHLQQWVESGGRLVVDSSLISAGSFASWSGISRAERPESSPVFRKAQAQAGKHVEYVSTCRNLTEESDTQSHATRQYALCGLDTTGYLTASRHAVWALRDSTGAQAVRVLIGRGSVTVINAMPFRYLTLFDGNQAPLFVALTQLRAGDPIRFLSEQEQASLVALTWRYGGPVITLLLVILALTLWRSSPRFGPLEASPEAARRSLAEQIRGTGHFAARTGGAVALHAATLRALQETASRYIRGYARLASTEQIAVVASQAGVEPDALAAATHYSGARRGIGLRNCIALLESARRRILMRQARSQDGN